MDAADEDLDNMEDCDWMQIIPTYHPPTGNTHTTSNDNRSIQHHFDPAGLKQHPAPTIDQIDHSSFYNFYDDDDDENNGDIEKTSNHSAVHSLTPFANENKLKVWDTNKYLSHENHHSNERMEPNQIKDNCTTESTVRRTSNNNHNHGTNMIRTITGSSNKITMTNPYAKRKSGDLGAATIEKRREMIRQYPKSLFYPPSYNSHTPKGRPTKTNFWNDDITKFNSTRTSTEANNAIDFVSDGNLENRSQQQHRAQPLNSTIESDREKHIKATTEKYMKATTTTDVTGNIPVTNSYDIPFWKRLPSSTVSFGSAKVVTINELWEHIQSKYNSQSQKQGNIGEGNTMDDCGAKTDESSNNVTDLTSTATTYKSCESYRITGVVVERVVHTDGSLSLLLIDPIDEDYQNQLKQRYRQKRNKENNAKKDGINKVSTSISTPYLLQRNKSTIKPVFRKKMATSSSNTPTSSSLLSSKKLSILKPSPVGISTSLTRGSINRKRPRVDNEDITSKEAQISVLTSDTTKNSVQSSAPNGSTILPHVRLAVSPIQSACPVTNALLQNYYWNRNIPHTPASEERKTKCVWVIVPTDMVQTRPSTVSNVDDLVMIIGELRSCFTSVGNCNDTRLNCSDNYIHCKDAKHEGTSCAQPAKNNFQDLDINPQSNPVTGTLISAIQAMVERVVSFKPSSFVRDNSYDDKHDNAHLTGITGNANSKGSTDEIQYWFIETRIVRNVNGTDMQSYTHAFFARRHLLQALRNDSKQYKI